MEDFKVTLFDHQIWVVRVGERELQLYELDLASANQLLENKIKELIEYCSDHPGLKVDGENIPIDLWSCEFNLVDSTFISAEQQKELTWLADRIGSDSNWVVQLDGVLALIYGLQPGQVWEDDCLPLIPVRLREYTPNTLVPGGAAVPPYWARQWVRRVLRRLYK